MTTPSDRDPPAEPEAGTSTAPEPEGERAPAPGRGSAGRGSTWGVFTVVLVVGVVGTLVLRDILRGEITPKRSTPSAEPILGLSDPATLERERALSTPIPKVPKGAASASASASAGAAPTTSPSASASVSGGAVGGAPPP